MNIRLWLVFHIFVLGCVTIEIGVFLRKLDENLKLKLSCPHVYNTTQLFKDLAAYSFNINRLLRLFKLQREHVMEAAKWVYTIEHPSFIRNFSCEKVKMDFSMTERQYKDLLHFMEKITTSLSDFYKACQENPGFVGIPLQKPQFSLERIAGELEWQFKNPDRSIKKYKVLKNAEEYYYLLGKFTKKFILGRKGAMSRAKLLFESGGPQFLKYYDYFRLQKAYMLTVLEAATLDSFITKIKKRYDQFTNACFKNPNFESKVDYSSIGLIQISEKNLKEILSHPSPQLSTQLFKEVRNVYHVLGFLRRNNIPNRMALLQALKETFGKQLPTILNPLNFEQIKSDFQLDESMITKLQEYIGYLRHRFDQVQYAYLNPNTSDPSLL